MFNEIQTLGVRSYTRESLAFGTWELGPRVAQDARMAQLVASTNINLLTRPIRISQPSLLE